MRSWRVREPHQRTGPPARRPWAIRWCWSRPSSCLPGARGGGASGTAALFAGRHWDDVRLPRHRALPVVARRLRRAAGLALFLLDLVPLVAALRRPRPAPCDARRRERRRPRRGAAAGRRRRSAMPAAAGRLPRPRGRRSSSAPGSRRHTVVISRGAIDLLDRGRAARRARPRARAPRAPRPRGELGRDGGARAHVLQPRLPGALPRHRADAEWLADERAAAVCGDRLALASGLIKLYRATAGAAGRCGARSRSRRRSPEPLARARSLDVELRCRRAARRPARAGCRWAAAARRARGRVPPDPAVLRGMTASVDAGAARAGDPGSELARMLASFFWVVRRDRWRRSRCSAWLPVLARRRQGRRPRRDGAGGGAAPRRARPRPRLLPGAALLAARRDPRRGRAARLGPARASLPRRRAAAWSCCRRSSRARRSRRSCSRAAPCSSTSPATLGGRPATLADVLWPAARAMRELAWELQGRAMVLRSAGDVEELFRMAKSAHREGGR